MEKKFRVIGTLKLYILTKLNVSYKNAEPTSDLRFRYIFIKVRSLKSRILTKLNVRYNNAEPTSDPRFDIKSVSLSLH